MSSLFEAVEVVWCMPVAYQSAKLRQLVLARPIYTKYLPLMADDPLAIYGLRHGERDHTPKCHQHQEQGVQQPLTKELRSTDSLALSIRGGYQ